MTFSFTHSENIKSERMQVKLMEMFYDLRVYLSVCLCLLKIVENIFFDRIYESLNSIGFVILLMSSRFIQ